MYTSRVVGVGKYKSYPLVFFTLASKSIPYRELRINEKAEKIHVFFSSRKLLRTFTNIVLIVSEHPKTEPVS
jgi:IMP cyclohydrolase